MLNVQLSIEHSSEMRDTLHEERPFATNLTFSGVPSNQAVYLNIPGWTSISTQVILSAEMFSRRACSSRDSGLGASYSQ